MNIIWIASYPKSGNTWLRFFLYSYYYGIPMNSGDISEKIPDIHTPNQLEDDFAGRVFCKTHFAMSDQHPYLNKTAGFIYIIRHPKDVLLSNLNYLFLTGSDQIDAVNFSNHFIKNKGLKVWCQAKMGTWSENVESWANFSAVPRLIVKYEDLRGSPRKIFSTIIEFLGEQVDEKRLNQALQRSSFENMRRLEDKEKMKNKFSPVFWGNPATAKNGLRFMNRGGINQKLNNIDAELDDAFDKAFERELRNFGYLN